MQRISIRESKTMLITSREEFKKIEELVKKVFDIQKDLPNQVFKQGFKDFVFEEFAWCEGTEFWDIAIKELGKLSGDTEIIVMIPEDNRYVRTYGFYTTFKIPLTCTGKEYWKLLHTEIIKELRYEPWLLAEKVIFMPPSGTWALWCRRGYEICVLGFTQQSSIKTLLTKNEWTTASDIIRISKNCFLNSEDHKKFSDIFMKNYADPFKKISDLEQDDWRHPFGKDSQEDEISIYEKNGARYVVRNNTTSTKSPVADFYKAGSKCITVKIRLQK